MFDEIDPVHCQRALCVQVEFLIFYFSVRDSGRQAHYLTIVITFVANAAGSSINPTFANN